MPWRGTVAQSLYLMMTACQYIWLVVPQQFKQDFGGVDVLCMVDSGSMVSFVTEDFYNKKLQPTCGHMRKDGQMLTLRAANGLEIPYLGYLELTVEVDGVKVPSCGVLVLRNTPATTKQRRDMPELLATNVLVQIPQFGALLQQRPDAEPRTSENPS